MREERVYLGHITEFQDKKYYFKGTAENIAIHYTELSVQHCNY